MYCHSTNIEQATYELNQIPVKENASYPSRVFVTSNEENLPSTIERLKNQNFYEMGCHIGVSSLFNFHLGVLSKPSLILMIDVNPRVMEFNRLAIELLKESSTKVEFSLSLADFFLQNAVDGNPFHHYDFTPRNEQGECLLGPTSFSIDKFAQITLNAFTGVHSTFELDEAYIYIKSLANAGRIVAITADLSSEADMGEISRIMKKYKIKINTFYISNVRLWVRVCKNNTDDAFVLQNIKKLCNKKTLIIDSEVGDSKKLMLHVNTRESYDKY